MTEKKLGESLSLSTQCAAVMMVFAEMIDPPHIGRPPDNTTTCQGQEWGRASDPAITRWIFGGRCPHTMRMRNWNAKLKCTSLKVNLLFVCYVQDTSKFFWSNQINHLPYYLEQYHYHDLWYQWSFNLSCNFEIENSSSLHVRRLIL